MIQEYTVAFSLIQILSGICFFLCIVLIILLMTDKTNNKKSNKKIKTYRDRLK